MYHLPDLKLYTTTKLQSSNSMVLAQKQTLRSMEQNRAREIKSHLYGPLIYNKGGENIQQGKYSLFNK